MDEFEIDIHQYIDVLKKTKPQPVLDVSELNFHDDNLTLDMLEALMRHFTIPRMDSRDFVPIPEEVERFVEILVENKKESPMDIKVSTNDKLFKPHHYSKLEAAGVVVTRPTSIDRTISPTCYCQIPKKNIIV